MNDTQTLKTVLTDLNKGHWLQPLQSLVTKFRRLPEEDSFETELLNLLLQLRADFFKDSSLPLHSLVAIRISNLVSFSYRFSAADGTPLNPLQDPEKSFATSVLSQAQHAYPAPDIIRRWSREHLT